MSESSAVDIQVSERAARRIGEILQRESDGAMLRVSVEGGGCSGFQYRFDIERDRSLHVLHVLSRDLRNRDVVDIDLIFANEIQQQIEWALVLFELKIERGRRHYLHTLACEGAVDGAKWPPLIDAATRLGQQ